MHIYHLKTCDTCKKAIKALTDREPQLTDVRSDGMPSAVLRRCLDAVGADLLVNRKSTTWRTLSEAERAGDAFQLLSDHPTLMKRPVIMDGNDIHVGWGKPVQEALGVF